MYKYICDKCHAYIEREIKMADYDKVKDQQRCSNCGSKLRRIIEAPSINLNGNGYGIDGSNGWASK